MSCSKKSNGCNNARKYKTLDWEFFPPTVGVIENIVINFSNGYDCYVPVLFIGDRIEETFEFDLDIHKYVLCKPVCVPECSSKPYTIKVTAHSPCKIECPIIEMDFVAHKRNEVEKYLDDGEIVEKVIINGLNSVCKPQLFYDGRKVGDFEYDANGDFVLEKIIINNGNKLPYVVKTVDDCVCGSECILDKEQIAWVQQKGGLEVAYGCNYLGGVSLFTIVPVYKIIYVLLFLISEEEFPVDIVIYAYFIGNDKPIPLEYVSPYTYILSEGTVPENPDGLQLGINVLPSQLDSATPSLCNKPNLRILISGVLKVMQ